MPARHTEPCPYCNGLGDSRWGRCPECNGTGWAQDDEYDWREELDDDDKRRERDERV